MLDFRPVLYIIGILLCVLACFMLLPLTVDMVAGHTNWHSFAIAASITFFFGVTLASTYYMDDFSLSVREGFLLTTSMWLTASLFGALPFLLVAESLSLTDALFESVSGVTTTGSTVVSELAERSKGFLLWRALLQWLGGIGFVVMAVAILPVLRIGGMQLFQLDSSTASQKAFPRVGQVAMAIGAIYFALTFLCALCLYGFGMTGFEAVAHSMTTVATGGFSTSDDSIGGFATPAIDVTITFFMVLGSLPFVLYLRVHHMRAGSLWLDSQVRAFLATLVSCIAVLVLWRLSYDDGTDLVTLVREVAFNTVSLMTGTGFVTSDATLWGSFAVTLLFFLMLAGGCAGSTTCGIKIFRFQIAYAVAACHIKRIAHPRGVFVPYYHGTAVPQDIAESVMGFIFLFAFTFLVLALSLTWVGLDFQTSMSAAATAIANVGPALGGDLGPTDSFAYLPDHAKWLLSGGMLIGRLEIYTALITLLPRFWRW
ncbi:MAG: TrkH family potassium uptake protein [Alphaproteobacteria bacterium GM7ARS4]|nr:TrkH family potassium uptake protein [Alphaproteobacteria bacterium GM7ARS4]